MRFRLTGSNSESNQRVLGLACCHVNRSWVVLGRILLYEDAVALLDVKKHSTRLDSSSGATNGIGRTLPHSASVGRFVRALKVTTTYHWDSGTYAWASGHFSFSLDECPRSRSLRSARLWCNVACSLRALTLEGISPLTAFGKAVIDEKVRFCELGFLRLTLTGPTTLFRADGASHVYFLPFALTEVLQVLPLHCFALECHAPRGILAQCWKQAWHPDFEFKSLQMLCLEGNLGVLHGMALVSAPTAVELHVDPHFARGASLPSDEPEGLCALATSLHSKRGLKICAVEIACRAVGSYHSRAWGPLDSQALAILLSRFPQHHDPRRRL